MHALSTRHFYVENPCRVVNTAGYRTGARVREQCPLFARCGADIVRNRREGARRHRSKVDRSVLGSRSGHACA